MNRTITCSNDDGVTIVFGETRESMNPFLIESVDGLYLTDNTVTISSNTMTDGGTYQGTVAKVRNIVLTVRDLNNHSYNRNLLAKLFKSGAKGTLVYKDDLNERKCEYYTERIQGSGEGRSRVYTISLLCPDPFFYDMEDISVSMASWIRNFTFPHIFKKEKEVFGYRSLNRLQNIINESAESGIGLTIEIYANGDVTNPTITRVESDTHITVGTDLNPMNLVIGDRIVITTAVNNKHVYLIHDNVWTEINHFLTEDSEFIQLQRGNNNIGYSALSGADNMVVTITYRFKYSEV